jgi:hypothetical protein
MGRPQNLHCRSFPAGGQGDYHNSLAVPRRLLAMATRTSIALVLTIALSRRGSSSTLYNVQGSHRHSGRAEGTGAARRGSEGDNVSDEVLHNFEPFDERLRTREAADSVTDLHVVFSNRTPHPSIHPSIHPLTRPPFAATVHPLCLGEVVIACLVLNPTKTHNSQLRTSGCGASSV